MNKADILTLFDYNFWANERVLDATAKVTAEQFSAPTNTSHGSLKGTLVHILAAEVVWRLRFEKGVSPPALLSESEFASLDLLVERWRREEKAMRAYLNSVQDEDLHRSVRYATTRGVPYENTLWTLLVHVVNHGTQFRAEAAIALTGYDQSPGDLDMILFFRENEQ